MKVRIGITTRNRAELLPKAIESVYAQDYPDKELIIYDIASTDDTPQLRAKFPQALWIRSEVRLDMISPRNQIMRETDAELYFTLDDDAWFLAPDSLSYGVDLMKRNPKLAVLAYDILLPGSKPLPLRGGTRPAHLFIACGALLRRSALEQVGYYRPVPAVYGGAEEIDLCLRLFDAGFDVLKAEGTHVWHEKTQVGRDNNEQFSSNVCNELATTLAVAPNRIMAPLLAWKAFRYGMNALRGNRLGAYWSGLRLFAQSARNTSRTRTPVSMRAYREFVGRRNASANG